MPFQGAFLPSLGAGHNRPVTFSSLVFTQMPSADTGQQIPYTSVNYLKHLRYLQPWAVETKLRQHRFKSTLHIIRRGIWLCYTRPGHAPFQSIYQYSRKAGRREWKGLNGVRRFSLNDLVIPMTGLKWWAGGASALTTWPCLPYSLGREPPLLYMPKK